MTTFVNAVYNCVYAASFLVGCDVCAYMHLIAVSPSLFKHLRRSLILYFFPQGPAASAAAHALDCVVASCADASSKQQQQQQQDEAEQQQQEHPQQKEQEEQQKQEKCLSADALHVIHSAADLLIKSVEPSRYRSQETMIKLFSYNCLQPIYHIIDNWNAGKLSPQGVRLPLL